MTPQNGRLVVGADSYTKLTLAQFKVAIDVNYPGCGTPGNPIARFDDFQIYHAIQLSTEAPEDSGVDAGLEPFVELFEPLVNESRYYLPWNIPPGTRLTDDGQWDGWSAHLGNDNSWIKENLIEFVRATRTGVLVRWTGKVPDVGAFEFEGEVAVGPMIMHGLASMNVAEILEQAYGPSQALELEYDREPLPRSSTPGMTCFHLRRRSV